MIRSLVKLLFGVDVRMLRTERSHQHLFVYKAEISGLASPKTIALKHISSHFILLALLHEDELFFSHGAFNWREFRRRVSEMIFKGSIGSGSSIAQQVSKVFFASHNLFIRRKIKEALISIALEKEYSKEELLRLYLNSLRLAGEDIAGPNKNVLGVEEASRFYFDKPASELSLTESLFLSGLISAPLTRTRHLLVDKTESDSFYKTAFLKLFDLLRAYYAVLGPLMPQELNKLTSEQALEIAKSPLFKNAPLNPSEYLALENRAAVETLALKELVKTLQKQFGVKEEVL